MWPFNLRGVATWGFILIKDKKISHSDFVLACKPFCEIAKSNYAEYTVVLF